MCRLRVVACFRPLPGGSRSACRRCHDTKKRCRWSGDEPEERQAAVGPSKVKVLNQDLRQIEDYELIESVEQARKEAVGLRRDMDDFRETLAGARADVAKLLAYSLKTRGMLAKLPARVAIYLEVDDNDNDGEEEG